MVDEIAIVDKIKWLSVIVSWRETPLVRRSTMAALEHIEPVDAGIRLLRERRSNSRSTKE